MKTSTPVVPQLTAAKVLDQRRERIRHLHYSLWTDVDYVY